MSAFIWCRIPELFGAEMEAINGIAQELDISSEYLGSSLEGDVSV